MDEQGKTPGFFAPTVWSEILRAKNGSGDVRAQALERLFTRYRTPILRHIQATCRCSPDKAEDLTQEFLGQCVRLDFLKNVSPERGRFRAFVKACIRNFLRDQALKQATRDDGHVVASLQETDAEGKPILDAPAPALPLEVVIDREWARCVLDHSLAALRRECGDARRAALFDALKGHLGHAEDPGTARMLGTVLGLSEGAIHVALHRLRSRLGEIIREEIRQTVDSDAQLQEELRYLIELLSM